MDTLVLCSNAPEMYYPTSVATQRGVISAPAEQAAWIPHERQSLANMQAVEREGIDSYAVRHAEARKRGIEAPITCRVNGAHGIDFLLTAFWRDHPGQKIPKGAARLSAGCRSGTRGPPRRGGRPTVRLRRHGARLLAFSHFLPSDQWSVARGERRAARRFGDARLEDARQGLRHWVVGALRLDRFSVRQRMAVWYRHTGTGCMAQGPGWISHRRGHPAGVASLHRMIRHSNVGLYCVGNISPAASCRNRPRHPLVMAKVDEVTAFLQRETVTVNADRSPWHEPDVQGSNFSLIGDRETREPEQNGPQQTFGGSW